MLGYRSSGRDQSRRLGPLLLASIVASIVAVSDAQEYCGPQIITYGERGCVGDYYNLPYQIQTPEIPEAPRGSPSYLGPPGGRTYCYGISAPTSELHRSNVGFHLPLSVQQPVLPESQGHQIRPDPLQGRSYGIGIQSGPSAIHQQPSSSGAFDFGVQNSVPEPKRQSDPRDPTSHLRVQVQPVWAPHFGSSLWGPLPIGVERPAEERSQDASVPPRRLTGLTSKIDRLLIPASDLPCNPRANIRPSCGCSL